MSTLSKILVVLLVLLAIAHSAVLLAYLSQQKDWKTLAQAGEKALERLRARRASETMAHKQIQDQLLLGNRTLQDKLARTETDLKKQQDATVALNLRLGTLTAEKESLQQELTRLTASLRLAQDAQKHATDQLDAATNTANKLKAENAHLEIQLAQLTMDVDKLTAEVRSKKEQIFYLNSEIRRAQGVMTAKTPPTATMIQPAAVVAAKPIKGRVTEVNLDANIAQINVGQIAGVAEGLKFIVYDRDGYVGDLKIIRVLRDQSLGTIVLFSKAVKVGDEVATELK